MSQNRSSWIVPIHGVNNLSSIYRRPFEVERPGVEFGDAIIFLQNSSMVYLPCIICRTDGSVVIVNTRLTKGQGSFSNDSPGKALSGTCDRMSATVLSSPGI